ncbi:MAG TPA: hypothetical protein VFK13_09935 [Gemmatimonadaceae bacterium]|nr:hypothetical protein [Gemmatimonadaceae bacterium]
MRWPLAMAIASLLVAASDRLAAQAAPDSIDLRNDCRRARQLLETGRAGPHRVEALSLIPLCGPDAVPALLSVWSAPPTTRSELEILVTSTRALVTQHLVQTLLTTLQRTDLTSVQRLAGMLVLVTYADSTVAPNFDVFLAPRDTVLATHYGHVDHPFIPIMQDALPVPVRDQLTPVLEELAEGDPDPIIRTAAEVVLRSLRY